MKINKHGKKLLTDFQNKINFFEVVESDDFDGMCVFENNIESVNEAAAWMLLTYDTDALYCLENWMNEFDDDSAWNVSFLDVHQELLKCVEWEACDGKKYTWDELHERAENARFLSRELKALDTARDTMEEIVFDILGQDPSLYDCPQDEVETFIHNHPTTIYFDESGNLLTDLT